jgi:hypothetical protein
MGSLDYAHARLSARYGQRANEAAWRRIEHLRELPALLDAARNSALGAWLAGIGPAATPHEIERVLRMHWRAEVAEIAAWMPAAWQGAVRWCAVAIDLPLVLHLARGEAMPAWAADDSTYGDFAGREAADRGAAPAAGRFAPLRPAWTDPPGLGGAWRAEWERRLPKGALADGTLLAELVRVLQRHLAAFRDPALRDGWPLRRALEARLVLLFRRAILDPAAAFVFVALCALDLERLRGELVRRAAFPGFALTP